MFHRFFRWFASLFLALALSLSGFTPALAAPPANDNFANAEVIPSLPFSVTVDSTAATSEPGEPQGCGGLFRSLWYSFIPTENMAVRVDMVGSAVVAGVNIYLASGSAISDLTLLACSSTNSSTNFQVEAGKTYYLQVDSGFGQAGIIQVNLEQLTPPTNDNFANAETITSLPFSATVDNTDATLEPDEPAHCFSPVGSVWYSFTPTENMTVRIDMLDSSIVGHVDIYLASGPGISDLTFLACSFSSNSTYSQVEAGKTYYLQVDSGFGQTGLLQFNLEQIFPPANDNFANAEAITSLPFSTTTMDHPAATSEPGEPQGCGSVLRTFWYSFTPSENMAVRLDMVGSAVVASVNIYLASAPATSGLTLLACTFTGSSTNIQVEAGKTYYLQVDSSGQAGALQVNLEQIFPPANDNFINAETITSLPFSATPNNEDATTEPNETFGLGCGARFRSVWYSFTPSENMTVRINMLGSFVGGIVNIYLASGPAISDLTFLACAGSSSTNIQVEAGKTYYLQVDSFGEAGSLQINLEQIFPPANDNFINAEAISAPPFSVIVDNTDATTEPGEPQGCGAIIRNVWYAFTPTENMALRIDTIGTERGIGEVVNIYLASGPTISDLTFLACAYGDISTNIQVEAGKTYYLQVDSSGLAGAIQVNLEQIFPPANDNFANAEAITSLPFSVTVDNTDATAEPGEPQDCISPFRNVWYAFTPTENMTVRVDMLGSFVGGVVNIYLASGPTISDLTFVACAGSGSTDIQFEAGKTYYLRVDSFGQPGVIEIDLERIPPPVNEVTIDIKPGSRLNPINRKGSGKISVAILSTPDFNALLEVDKISLAFGRTGDELSLAFCEKASKDVDRDGLPDLVCQFKTRLTGFQVGDTVGILKGLTVDGIPIEGRDTVRILK